MVADGRNVLLTRISCVVKVSCLLPMFWRTFGSSKQCAIGRRCGGEDWLITGEYFQPRSEFPARLRNAPG